MLISGSSDSKINTWILETSQLSNTFTNHTGEVYVLVDLGSGLFASGSADKTVKIWSENELKYDLIGHSGAVYSLFYQQFESYNLSFLLSGSADNTIIIWDMQKLGTDNFLFKQLYGHKSTVISFAYVYFNSTDTMYTSSADGEIKKWDWNAGLALYFSVNIFGF